MSDTFLSIEAIFETADQTRLFATALDNQDAENLEYQPEMAVCDDCYLQAQLMIDEPFDLDFFVDWVESAGALVISIEIFEESEPDEVIMISRKERTKARASTVRKMLDAASPAMAADMAISEGEYRKVEKMLAEGLNPNAVAFKQPLLMNATHSAYKRPEFIELLLDNGADPNCIGCRISWEPGDGMPEKYTPLYDIATCGGPEGYEGGSEKEINNVRAARALLAAGANPDRGGPHALASPIAAAAYGGRYELVEVLLEAGANIDLDFDFTALSAAIIQYSESGNDDVLRTIGLLLRRGAKTSITDADGKPLGDALELHPEFLKVGQC